MLLRNLLGWLRTVLFRSRYEYIDLGGGQYLKLKRGTAAIVSADEVPARIRRPTETVTMQAARTRLTATPDLPAASRVSLLKRLLPFEVARRAVSSDVITGDVRQHPELVDADSDFEAQLKLAIAAGDPIDPSLTNTPISPRVSSVTCWAQTGSRNGATIRMGPTYRNTLPSFRSLMQSQSLPPRLDRRRDHPDEWILAMDEKRCEHAMSRGTRPKRVPVRPADDQPRLVMDTDQRSRRVLSDRVHRHQETRLETGGALRPRQQQPVAPVVGRQGDQVTTQPTSVRQRHRRRVEGVADPRKEARQHVPAGAPSVAGMSAEVMSEMTPSEQIQALLEELDLEIEPDGGRAPGETGRQSVDPQMEVELELPTVRTGERVTVEPYQPGHGHNQDATYRVSQGATQIEDTTKHRPECPACGHLLANPDEPTTLLAKCAVCRTHTCLECKQTCTACGEPLCSTCVRGQGLQGGEVCPDCRADIKEELAFERAVARRERAQQELSEIVEQTRDSSQTSADLALQAEAQKWTEAKEWQVEARNDLSESWKQLRERWIEEREDGELGLSKLSHALDVAEFLKSNRTAAEVKQDVTDDERHGKTASNSAEANARSTGSLPILR